MTPDPILSPVDSDSCDVDEGDKRAWRESHATQTQDYILIAAPTQTGAQGCSCNSRTWDSEAGASLRLRQVNQVLVVRERTCLKTKMETGLVATLLAPALGA